MPINWFNARHASHNINSSRSLDLPSGSWLGTPSVSATWAVPEQEKKAGVGILLFAYGSEITLNHFLKEAGNSARSFRAAGVDIKIAVVTNNATVDRKLFDIHIQPRKDLLFAGDPCPYGAGKPGCNPKARPRQWMTRLYYLAMTPFEVTWALDSNSACCDPRAAAAFLKTALSTSMWGFDIATANQGHGPMYPHNWNIMYRWTRSTSNMMRDWLMLQMRRGLGTDDQATLFAAQQRQRASGGLRVGQMPAPFASAFYSPRPPKFFPRITRPITGAVVVFHTGTNTKEGVRQSCTAFNEAQGVRRQIWIEDKVNGVITPMRTLRSSKQCRAAIGLPKCPFTGTRPPEDSVFTPMLVPVHKLKMKWR
jgi:hypothetical protein